MAVSRRKKVRTKRPGIVLVLLVVIALYSLYVTGRNIERIWRITAIKRAEQHRLDEIVARLDSLKIEKERLQNDSTYIEEIARREYGMVKEGEEVYYITLPDSSEGEEQ